jgi:hypothetical protein
MCLKRHRRKQTPQESNKPRVEQFGGGESWLALRLRVARLLVSLEVWVWCPLALSLARRSTDFYSGASVIGAGTAAVVCAIHLGGTAAGILATTLASSPVVCGSLFGAYGARESSAIIRRHTKDVHDLAIVPVRPPNDALAIRICVSGWLNTKDDVVDPWKIFDQSQDTSALQWEVDALLELSRAWLLLLKDRAVELIQKEAIKQTILASLFAGIPSLPILSIGIIICE